MAHRFAVLPLRTKDSTIVGYEHYILHDCNLGLFGAKLCIRSLQKVIKSVQKTILENLKQYWTYCYATEIITY